MPKQRNILDIKRVLAEMHTFTAKDVSEALECSKQNAYLIISHLMDRHDLESITIGNKELYACTEKLYAYVRRFTPIDPNERALLLERVWGRTWSGCCPDCNVHVDEDGWLLAWRGDEPCFVCPNCGFLRFDVGNDIPF